MSKKQFYHAVNKRQEIEGCAQYILQHDISAQDIQITLTDTTYAPIVKQILNDTKFHIRFFPIRIQVSSPSVFMPCFNITCGRMKNIF